MSSKWYYVLKGERKGPVEQTVLTTLINQNNITAEDYIWRKGFDNWMKLKDVPELNREENEVKAPPVMHDTPVLSLRLAAGNESSIYIKIGADRGVREVEYGPFSLEILKRLYKEKRVNAKTFIYIKGLTNWMVLGDYEDFSEVFEELPPKITESDRRVFGRKPFIARMFIQSYDAIFEGICRDISVGGMQVLTDNFPAKAGERISINVHPENTEHHFVAHGEVVRLLDGNQGFSFRFLNLNPEAVSSIKNYLDNA